MLLDKRLEAGVFTYSVGKIFDIFCERGFTDHIKMNGNADGIAKTIEAMKMHKSGFIFTNLVDFDMLYGHRNDVEGYATALEQFDSALPRIEGLMGPRDLLLMTADHGCDPTTESTDHSREYCPLLAFTKQGAVTPNLGTRKSLADVGQTVAEVF